MKLTLSVPSKTFLAGEYAVLVGGPALILNTEPRFQLIARDHSETRLIGVPEGSPAAHWYQQRAPLLEGWTMEFVDPHEGRGGFGGSSAEFVLLHCLTTFLQSSVARAVEGVDLGSLWSDYQTLTGSKGSGADVLAQVAGQVAMVDPERARSTSHPWPFTDLAFTLARTHGKLRTHQHLHELDRSRLGSLVRMAENVNSAFADGETGRFVSGVEEFGQALREIQLQSEETAGWLDELEAKSWCLAVKGCGALGADTILVLHAPTETSAVRKFFEARGLAPLIGPEHLTGGLEMSWSWSNEI